MGNDETMSEVYVGKIADFDFDGRRIVQSGDLEIGVLHRAGEFYAYQNVCVHQGGPACEGLTIAKVEEVLAPDKTYIGQRFSQDEIHFVCPWHGYEYDLKTGEFVGDRRRRLKKFDVITKGDEVYVVV
jgi:nitrite reductase/ring-hydroxylating ferredoxin subunit